MHDFNIKIRRFSNDEIMNDPIKVIEKAIGRLTPIKKSSKLPKAELKRIRSRNQTAKRYSSKLDSVGKKKSRAIVSSGYYNY